MVWSPEVLPNILLPSQGPPDISSSHLIGFSRLWPFFSFFSHLSCFWWLDGFEGSGQVFVGCLIVEVCVLSFLKVGVWFWVGGGRLRSKVPLSSCVKPECTASVASDVDFARPAKRVFLIFFHSLSFFISSFTYCPLWEEVTVPSLYSGSGELYSPPWGQSACINHLECLYVGHLSLLHHSLI